MSTDDLGWWDTWSPNMAYTLGFAFADGVVAFTKTGNMRNRLVLPQSDRSILDEAGTAVFYKGNIKPMFAANDLGSDRLNRWREDFPATYRDGATIPAVARRQALCREYGWAVNEFAVERPLQVSFFDSIGS